MSKELIELSFIKIEVLSKALLHPVIPRSNTHLLGSQPHFFFLHLILGDWERGKYHIHAYLLIIQHESMGSLWNLHVRLVYLKLFEMIWQHTYRGSSFFLMWDGWDVRLYTIIPSLLETEVNYLSRRVAFWGGHFSLWYLGDTHPLLKPICKLKFIVNMVSTKVTIKLNWNESEFWNFQK